MSRQEVLVLEQEVEELLETAGRGDLAETLSILQSTGCVEKKETLTIELLLNLQVDNEDHPGVNVIKAILDSLHPLTQIILFKRMPWFSMRGSWVYHRVRLLLDSMTDDEIRFRILGQHRFNNEIYVSHDFNLRSHIHQAVSCRNTEVVRAMLDSVGQEYRFRLLTMRDGFKHAPLHDLCVSGGHRQGPVENSKEFILTKTMLACLSNEQRYEVLTMLNADDRIPFVDAFIHGHNDVVEGIKSSLSSEEWYTLLSSEQIRSFRGSDRKAYVTEAKVNAIIDIYATEQSGW